MRWFIVAYPIILNQRVFRVNGNVNYFLVHLKWMTQWLWIMENGGKYSNDTAHRKMQDLHSFAWSWITENSFTIRESWMTCILAKKRKTMSQKNCRRIKSNKKHTNKVNRMKSINVQNSEWELPKHWTKNV